MARFNYLIALTHPNLYHILRFSLEHSQTIKPKFELFGSFLKKKIKREKCRPKKITFILGNFKAVKYNLDSYLISIEFIKLPYCFISIGQLHTSLINLIATSHHYHYARVSCAT